jgi:hypothetical protein
LNKLRLKIEQGRRAGEDSNESIEEGQGRIARETSKNMRY